ncbi:MAG: hypothetical protein PHV30_00535 [Candidatus Margulisbacteria bacterium]|nr:hypothetical protein [Candidatus Margulisiibacteriota bacterium]
MRQVAIPFRQQPQSPSPAQQTYIPASDRQQQPGKVSTPVSKQGEGGEAKAPAGKQIESQNLKPLWDVFGFYVTNWTKNGMEINAEFLSEGFGVDKKTAESIIADLKNKGMLNAAGYLTVSDKNGTLNKITDEKAKKALIFAFEVKSIISGGSIKWDDIKKLFNAYEENMGRNKNGDGGMLLKLNISEHKFKQYFSEEKKQNTVDESACIGLSSMLQSLETERAIRREGKINKTLLDDMFFNGKKLVSITEIVEDGKKCLDIPEKGLTYAELQQKFKAHGYECIIPEGIDPKQETESSFLSAEMKGFVDFALTQKDYYLLTKNKELLGDGKTVLNMEPKNVVSYLFASSNDGIVNDEKFCLNYNFSSKLMEDISKNLNQKNMQEMLDKLASEIEKFSKGSPKGDKAEVKKRLENNAAYLAVIILKKQKEINSSSETLIKAINFLSEKSEELKDISGKEIIFQDLICSIQGSRSLEELTPKDLLIIASLQKAIEASGVTTVHSLKSTCEEALRVLVSKYNNAEINESFGKLMPEWLKKQIAGISAETDKQYKENAGKFTKKITPVSSQN